MQAQTEESVEQIRRRLGQVESNLQQLKGAITMLASELKPVLDKLNTQVDEIAAEINTLISSLTGVSIPQDAADSLNSLATKIQAADDLGKTVV